MGMIGGIPINVIFLIFLYAFVYWLLKNKDGTLALRCGFKSEAARVAGLPVGRYKISVYVITGVLCALAAVFLAGQIRSVDPTSGLGLELDAIAATVIGGTSLLADVAPSSERSLV
ncbi:hypothetical protein HGG75_27385 [Ochrobactrum pseudogrignonense]|nr:hypothetical protein [Brucella pseudogrignonensis]